MRALLTLLLAALLCALPARGLYAAVVQGVALDHETGSPLARALIQLVPVQGTPAQAVTLRSGERGTFSIMNVAPGWYIVRATRKAFAPAEVGQLRPNRPGRPFQVERDDQSFFFEVRMVRTAAVSGVVVDENNVGVPDWDVHVFSREGKKPVRKIAQGKTDDRGVFRIGALEPGTYVVRSGEGELEDGSTLIPTYHRYGTSLESAEPVAVKYGETAMDLRMQPVKGRLFSIQGKVPPACERLTLITENGRKQQSGGPFQFEKIAPGRVDLLAEGRGYAGILHVNLDRDLYNQVVPCDVLHPILIGWSADQAAGSGDSGRLSGTLMLRRVDLDGEGELKVVKSGDFVTPGMYEAVAIPSNPDQYAQNARFEYRMSRPNPDGSFPGEITYRSSVSIGLRNQAPRITGTVLSDGRLVVGAPVYAELFDPTLPTREQRIRLWSLRTDASGKFIFRGLIPGRYHVLSSFDFDPDDLYAMSKAPEVLLKEGDASNQELKMLP